MERLRGKLRECVEILPERPRSFVKRFWVKTVADGLAANLRICALGTPRGYVLGTYEMPVQRALGDLLHLGDVLYDIGSNIGFFTILGAKRVGTSGHVYAFEPVPRNAATIRLNVRLNSLSNVTVQGQAVSDHEGLEEMWITRHPGGATLTSSGTVPPDKVRRLSVETVRIDNLLAEGKLRPPSLIKIDVEGAEIQVMSGMGETLKNYLPTVLYEIDDGDEKAFVEKIERTVAYLEDFGYNITRLEDAYREISWHVAHLIAQVHR